MNTEMEFEEKTLLAKVAKASVDILKRMGAYVRTVARRKVKSSDKPSQPGSPPHSKTGALKKGILFGLEKKNSSVLIGPSDRFVGTSASAHEFGGKYKKERYPKRPLMGPSLKESIPQLTKLWQDAVT